MSRKEVKRSDVNWDKANCRGINTELFFLPATELERRQFERKILRKVCAYCPIRLECLEVSVAYQEMGYWGGLAEIERKMIIKKQYDSLHLRVLKVDLKEVGLDFDELLFIQDVPIKKVWGENAS